MRRSDRTNYTFAKQLCRLSDIGDVVGKALRNVLSSFFVVVLVPFFFSSALLFKSDMQILLW